VVIGVLFVAAAITGFVVEQQDKAALKKHGYVDTGITTTYEECVAEGGHVENGACVGAVPLLVPGDCGVQHGRTILPASCEMGDFRVVGIAVVSSNPRKVCPKNTEWTTRSTKQLVCWARTT
jgi:hypothetical protein